MRIDSGHDNVPLVDQAAVAGDLWGIAWLHLLDTAAIDEDPRIDWIGEYLLNHLVGWAHPHQPPRIRPSLDVPGHL